MKFFAILRGFIVSVLLFVIFACAAQAVMPEQGSLLNFTQIMFEWQHLPRAETYVLQIKEDKAGTTFGNSIIQKTDSATATLVSGLEFGKAYQWRYAGIVGGKQTAWLGPFDFEITGDPYKGDSDLRVRVIKNDSLKNNGGFIVIDGLNGAVDRNGKRVWYEPESEDDFEKKITYYDLRINNTGTVTWLGGTNAGESDLRGNLLWGLPKAPTILLFGDYYHHDFRRLPNGHYMVCACNYVWKEIPAWCNVATLQPDSGYSGLPPGIKAAPDLIQTQNGYLIGALNGKKSMLINLADLVEFDKNDSVVWKWKSQNYLTDDDIFPPTMDFNVPYKEQDPHLNAFCESTDGKFLYVSFRNLDRIVKINKASGKVVNSWGKKMPSGEAKDSCDFFHKQHGINVLSDGSLAVFDNDYMEVKDRPSSLVFFSEPPGNTKSELLWKFNCDFDSLTRNKSVRGGNIDELANHNFLVSMGEVNRIFEITRNKEIVWNALLERNTHSDTGWVAQPMYRAHYTSSLYPCYFTINADKDTLNGSNTGFVLKIFNKGSEADLYSIQVSSGDKAYDKSLTSTSVQAGKSIHLNISPAKQPHGDALVTVTVKSIANPDLQRQINLFFKNK